MIKANEIKRGDAVNNNGKLLLVKDIEVQNPSARGASTLYKMRFSEVKTGLKVEERFKGDDILEDIQLTKRPVFFSFVDGDEYHFMDEENFTPYMFKQDQIEDELLFIPEGGMPGVTVMLADEQILGLKLPQTVDLNIVETAPGMKGALATSRTKPATMSTGLVVHIPEYINNEEKIKIHIAE